MPLTPFAGNTGIVSKVLRIPPSKSEYSFHAVLAPRKIRDTNERIRKTEHEKFEFRYDYLVLLDLKPLISADHFIFEQGKNEATSQLSFPIAKDRNILE